MSVPRTITDVRGAIAANNEQFMAAYNRGDAAGVADLYTGDGQLLPPNADIQVGREAVAGYWQAVMEAGIKGVELEIMEVEAWGDIASELSRYRLYNGEGQQLDHGKYIIIWKREDGAWRIHRDIFNSSTPSK
ncbi:MAG: SgcJ/EcaC family oxidoreductase [Chloroflexota bacterium]|nr:SgcJ/EcaC family oxidoreductase [Chloroflexota bacterium]